MRHLMVMRDGDALRVMHHHAGEALPLVNHGQTYAAPADVLNGTAFNAQYGWMVDGFWTPPSGASLWIELQSQTPGLMTYEMGTFAPLFETEGSSARYQWNGTMRHNWYAVTAPGAYEATYTLYFGDATGEPIDGYDAATVTLNWSLTCGAADLAQPVGSLDIDDVLAFLGAFASGDAAADLAPGDGLNVDDVLAFLAAFQAGCP